MQYESIYLSICIWEEQKKLCCCKKKTEQKIRTKGRYTCIKQNYGNRNLHKKIRELKYLHQQPRAKRMGKATQKIGIESYKTYHVISIMVVIFYAVCLHVIQMKNDFLRSKKL